MEIKTTMRYYLTPVRLTFIKKKKITSVGKNVERREPSYTVGGNVNWCNHYRKQYGVSSKNYRQKYHTIQQFHFFVVIWKKTNTSIWRELCTHYVCCNIIQNCQAIWLMEANNVSINTWIKMWCVCVCVCVYPHTQWNINDKNNEIL